MIIVTDVKIVSEETQGLRENLWYKSIYDFYTIEGATALANYFKTWKGGHLVINIAELPYKCPVAPLEFAFFADAFFTERGMRDKVKITCTTPCQGPLQNQEHRKCLVD